MNKQIIKQDGGKNSENKQYNDISENKIVVINNGITYDEAKSIALDVYNSEELKKYTIESQITVKQRVEELVVDFLNIMFKEKPEFIQNLRKPSIQQSFLNAEKGYAVDETGYSKETYIELMKARLAAPDRSLLQIFEDEAIKLVEKLTKSQMDYLTFIYLVYSYHKELNNRNNIIDYCNKLSDLYNSDFNNPITLFSLEAVGACNPIGGDRKMKKIEEWFNEIIPGMFYKGQTIDNIKESLEIDNIDIVKPILIANVWDRNLFQINALNIETLGNTIDKYKLNDLENRIIKMYNNQIMSPLEIKKQLIKINPKMEKVLSLWDDSDFVSRRISPQGKIIAIINYNNKYDDKIEFLEDVI